MYETFQAMSGETANSSIYSMLCNIVGWCCHSIEAIWWSWLAFKTHHSILVVFVAQLFANPHKCTALYRRSSLTKRLLLLFVYFNWTHTYAGPRLSCSVFAYNDHLFNFVAHTAKSQKSTLLCVTQSISLVVLLLKSV